MDLSIITVTYQSKNYIDGCILSVVTHTLHCTYEHIIVDNASTDGTVELIESGYAHFVHLIKNSKNVGFAAANNQAARIAQGRYLLFLNPDMELYEGYLDTLIEWMDQRPDVGLAGCKLLCASKIPCFSLRPHKSFSLFSVVPWMLGLRSRLFSRKFDYADFDDDGQREVEYVRGSFMFTRRAIVETLGFAFDPVYFILMEDNDLCQEVQRLKYKVMYVPFVSCIDYCSRSLSQRPKLWIYFQLVRSIKKYAHKWHSPLYLPLLQIAFFLGILFRIPAWTKNVMKK